MAYILHRLNALNLSAMLKNSALESTRQRVAATRVLPNGTTYSLYGGRTVPRGGVTYVKRGRLADDGTLDDYWHDLAALDGETATLYRRRDRTDEVHDTTAIVGVGLDRKASDDRLPRDFILTLELVGRAQWFGKRYGPATSWVYGVPGQLWGNVDQRYTLSSSPYAITLRNDGDDAYYDAVLNLTAGSANITGVTFAIGSASMTYSGTLTAGNVLAIDCGALTITNNGSNAIADWDHDGGHPYAEWLPIPAGGGTLTVTLTGGGTNSVLTVSHRDAWRAV